MNKIIKDSFRGCKVSSEFINELLCDNPNCNQFQMTFKLKAGFKLFLNLLYLFWFQNIYLDHSSKMQNYYRSPVVINYNDCLF